MPKLREVVIGEKFNRLTIIEDLGRFADLKGRYKTPQTMEI